MKRTLATALVIASLVAGVLGAIPAATAHPSKKSSCAGCHGSSSAVKVTVTRKKATATTVTYSVKVSGGSGASGWAVLAGGKNLARKSSSGGTFTVAKGKNVKVWGVKTGSGASAKSLKAK